MARHRTTRQDGACGRGTRRLARAAVAVAAGIGLTAAPAAPAAAAPPRAVCTQGPTRLEVRSGDRIPLPSRYANPTGSAVTFTLRMSGSSFFGPARDIGTVTLPPRTGRLAHGTLPTSLHTPLGRGRVVIEVRTTTTGATVVGRCDYVLRLSAPPPVQAGTLRRPVTRWLRQVPIQMCAVEGSAAAAGARPGQLAPAGGLLETLEGVNQIWYPQAQVAFSTASDTAVPVIADPTPPNGANGELGELDLWLGADALEPARLCSEAWRARFPGRRGIPVIVARDLVDQPATLGLAPGPDTGLYVAGPKPGTGARGDALCGAPVALEPADIGTPVVVMPDRAWAAARAARTLAHELGHTLFLGHGNGLDDDGNGARAGTPGPRRYDEYCDPGWLLAPQNLELAEERGVDDVCSLMHRFACSAELTPLQVETARGVARFIPGAVDGTPVPELAPAPRQE